MNRQIIADAICAEIQRDVDAKLRETGGKNRSPRIDEFNHRAHVPFGSAYCAAGGTCAIDDACKKLGLKNPVPITAGSQTAFTQAPVHWRSSSRGLKGGAAILQQNNDPSHGHYTTLREDMFIGATRFRTLEYNTGPDSGRDGDGAYAKTRSIVKGKTLHLRGFVDTVGWIMEANSIKG